MTFESLYTQIITDWCNKLGIPVDEAGYSMIVVSKVITAGLYLLVKMINALANNVWVGSMQAAKLLEVGQDKIGRGLYEAIKGEYKCSTIAKVPGGNIPAGTIFTFEIDGTLYKYESISLVAGGADITIRAMIAGTANLLQISDVPTAQQTLTYAESEITVTEVVENATDTEPIEDYRAIVIAYERLRLGNGNASDYKVWVANVNGLKTGYPYTADGEAGKAVIYCESTDNAVLIPTAGLIADAIDSIKYDINGKSQPPVGFFEFVNTTYVLPVQITGIKLIITNGDVLQQSDIEDVVRNYLEIKRPFLHTVNKYIQLSDDLNTLENTIALVDIIQILANASITFDSIDMQIDILLTTVYSVMSKYVVGYRGGSTYPTELLPSNAPALPLYYGECPRLELISFV
ncbi:MAG: baseplate J/gp47 family protein [Bacteroidales bacterium]|jgi:hypothetical protein|nr:baseplate J/gp47 family protein [Bacteroidales bacterium]